MRIQIVKMGGYIIEFYEGIKKQYGQVEKIRTMTHFLDYYLT